MRGIGTAGLCVLALAVLVGAGCGDDDSDEGSKATGASNTQKPKQGFSGRTGQNTKGRSDDPRVCDFERVFIRILRTGLRPELNCDLIREMLKEEYQDGQCRHTIWAHDRRRVANWKNEVYNGGKDCIWTTEKEYRDQEVDQFDASYR